jgi:hypothetical protein
VLEMKKIFNIPTYILYIFVVILIISANNNKFMSTPYILEMGVGFLIIVIMFVKLLRDMNK